MSIETYGDHAEAAASALNRLVVDDNIPVDPEAVDQLLHCREAVVDAIRQRLYAFGLTTHHRPASAATRASNLGLNGIDNRLATLLDRTAFEVPTMPSDKRQAPSEILTRPSADPTVEQWRHAAIALLAGSHALDVATEQPWQRDYGAGWYLMRDVAVAMEAFLVLDDRLKEVGLLTQHDHPEATMGLAERRLVASQCARVATWYATSDSPDHAAPRQPAEHTVLRPVYLVTTPTDLVTAQRRLASFLRPRHAVETTYLGEPEISAAAARQLVASQLFLTGVFAHMTGQAPKGTGCKAEFTSRREILEEIQPQLRYLVDVESHDPYKRRMWQQGEITSAVRRMQRDQTDLSLPPGQLLELTNATHEVTHNLARSLRRELLRDNSNLRIADPTDQVGATRVARRSPLEASLTDLINQPAPTAPVTRFSTALHRAALRQALDATPSQQQVPSPYPGVRPRVASDYPSF